MREPVVQIPSLRLLRELGAPRGHVVQQQAERAGVYVFRRQREVSLLEVSCERGKPFAMDEKDGGEAAPGSASQTVTAECAKPANIRTNNLLSRRS